MTIPVSNEALIVVIILYLSWMFYENRFVFMEKLPGKIKALYIGVLLGEIIIIFGSRFVTPNILKLFIDKSSSVFFFLDIAIFLLILVSVFQVGNILKNKILNYQDS